MAASRLLESDTLPKRAVTTEPHPPTNLPDDAALDHQVRAFLEGRPLIQAHIRGRVSVV
jgi:hypothetical protein